MFYGRNYLRCAHEGSECLEETDSSGWCAAQSANLTRSWNLKWRCHDDICSRDSSPKFRLPPNQLCFLLFFTVSHSTFKQMLRNLLTSDRRAVARSRGPFSSLWASAASHRALIGGFYCLSLNRRGFFAYRLFLLFSSDGRDEHFSCSWASGIALKGGTFSYLSAMPCWQVQYWWWNLQLGQCRPPWTHHQY